MSELKAVHAFDVYDAYTKTGDDDAAQVYLKSEADKAIAEKDKQIAELEKYIDELQDKVTNLLLRDRNMAQYFNNAVDALVHNKYKRCLAMADKCESMCYWFAARFDHHELVDNVKWELFDRWRLRWAKLADKFKEAK